MPSAASLASQDHVALRPLAAESRTGSREVHATALDCVRLVFIRDGSVILTGDCSDHPVVVGDAVLVAPKALVGYAPEGEATVTTLAIDTDYLIEHLYWQHVGVLADRDAARDLAARLYPDAIQVLRLGERQTERVGPILDQLIVLTEREPSPSRYFRAHALLLGILATIAPRVRNAPVALPPLTSRQRALRVASPRWREHKPVRREIMRTAVLMQNDIARRWSLAELAAHACLLTSQYNRLFKESFGVTPITYLSILRVQEMVRLLRETDLLIGEITDQVGWCHHCGHATLVFRRYMGVTPFRYRHHGPPSAGAEVPGMAVARAVADSLALTTVESSPTPCHGEPRTAAPARSR